MNSRLRTISLASVGAVAALALTAPAANAVTVPRVMYANADTQALHVSVNLPSVPQLKAALLAAGYPVSEIPAPENLAVVDHTLYIAKSTAASTKTGQKNIFSSSETRPVAGSITSPGAKSFCDAISCDAADSIKEGNLQLDLPLALGAIDYGLANTDATSYFKSLGETAAMELNMTLADLLGSGKTLAPLGEALDTVAATINANVLPTVNTAIDTAKTTVDGIAVLQPLKRELDRIITVDHVDPLPKFSTSELLTGTVLGGRSSVTEEVRGGTTGMLARSSSTVTDLKILGGWASIDSISVEAMAYANSVPGLGEAVPTKKMDVLNSNLGGLLGIHISADDLIRLATAETSKAVVRDTLKTAGVDQAITDLENAVDILYNTVGVTITKLADEAEVGKGGLSASSVARSMRIVIQPKLPKLDRLTSRSGGTIVPALTAADYVPTGIHIAVDLPYAMAQAGATTTQVFCVGSCIPVTGVAGKWFVAFGLLGAALLVRRFAFAR